ncbi:3,4-dioxygenase subunit beta [Microbacterium indicum]|uniref:dioxygenase family protein n=1 Tax=Microbacterium indicum TaxID=358100 RepID=UPI00056A626B|nr:3,4-dioxygenase subunit beta [Microbacterium indicum]
MAKKSNTPDPIETPEGPTYEGRLLHHPEDDVVDQGVRFDIGTIMSRRGVLSIVGLGAGAAILAACTPASSSSGATATATPTTTPSETPTATATPTPTATTPTSIDVASEIPDETAGPYPGDGSNGPDVLEDSGIVRSDITSSIDGNGTADGVPLTFTLQIVDMANGNAPFAGVAVYAWQCDQNGNYSMYSSGVEDYTYLRGVQVAGDDGTVTFTSIYPACYSGRWPHIHFEVYPSVDDITDSTNAISTSQMAMPDETNQAVFADSRYSASVQKYAQVSLATDSVFSDDSGATQLPSITGDVTNGYTATLVVGVDTTTEPTGGSAPSR